MIFAAGNIDVSQIIGLCVLVISFLSWFVNLIQGNKPQGGVRPKPQKPQSKPVQSDIETLLQQLTGEKPKPKPARREQTQTAPSPRPPKPPRDRGKNSPATTSPRNPSPGKTAARTVPAIPAILADSPLVASQIGSEVRSQHLGNRVDTAVNRDITAAVQHDLGKDIAVIGRANSEPIHPLVKVLRDPGGVRQALILNEILQRPKGLRN